MDTGKKRKAFWNLFVMQTALLVKMREKQVFVRENRNMSMKARMDVAD